MKKASFVEAFLFLNVNVCKIFLLNILSNIKFLRCLLQFKGEKHDKIDICYFNFISYKW